jgi:hypothetical protein
MLLPLLLASVTSIFSPASPTPAPDPCAHRIFCGRIRIVPADPAERRSFFANAIASLVDGIVTAHYVNGNPANESDPIVRPFVRGGMPALMLGWGVMELGQRNLARSFHISEDRADDFTLGSHISGVASWLSPRAYAWGVPPRLIYSDPYVEQSWIRYDSTGRTRF